MEVGGGFTDVEGGEVEAVKGEKEDVAERKRRVLMYEMWVEDEFQIKDW